LALTIRSATPLDRDIVCRLHNEVSRDAYVGMVPDEYLHGAMFAEREALWLKRCESPEEWAKMLVLIAEEASAPVGFIAFKLDENDPHGAYLNHVFVVRDFQSSGIGRRLIAAAIDAMPKKFAEKPTYLRAFARNTKAIRIYEKLGGKIVEHSASTNPLQAGAPIVRIEWPNAQALRDALGL
jgi:GNAT superfamily N-acetyltransferase